MSTDTQTLAAKDRIAQVLYSNTHTSLTFCERIADLVLADLKKHNLGIFSVGAVFSAGSGGTQRGGDQA